MNTNIGNELLISEITNLNQDFHNFTNFKREKVKQYKNCFKQKLSKLNKSEILHELVGPKYNTKTIQPEANSKERSILKSKFAIEDVQNKYKND